MNMAIPPEGNMHTLLTQQPSNAVVPNKGKGYGVWAYSSRLGRLVMAFKRTERLRPCVHGSASWPNRVDS
jgi:hypothetical protein